MKSLIRDAAPLVIHPIQKRPRLGEDQQEEMRIFFTRGQRNGGLRTSNPLANLQISSFHCFQEVRSHRPSMQEVDVGNLQGLQATELDCSECVCVQVSVCNCECKCAVCLSVCAWGHDAVRKGLSERLGL